VREGRGRETWSGCSSLPDSAPSELRMTVDDPWNRLPIAGKLALPAVSAGGVLQAPFVRIRSESELLPGVLVAPAPLPRKNEFS